MMCLPRIKASVQPVNIKTVNEEVLLNNLNTMDVDVTNIDDTVKKIIETLYECAKVSRREAQVQTVNATLGRWEMVVENNNDLDVWSGIDWKGEYENVHKSDAKLTTKQFKEYIKSRQLQPVYRCET